MKFLIFSIFVGHLCSPGTGSTELIDPDPIRIRIRYTAKHHVSFAFLYFLKGESGFLVRIQKRIQPGSRSKKGSNLDPDPQIVFSRTYIYCWMTRQVSPADAWQRQRARHSRGGRRGERWPAAPAAPPPGQTTPPGSSRPAGCSRTGLCSTARPAH